MNPNFILIDGHFFKNDEQFITLTRLENLLFVEKIRSIRDQIMFWDDHLALINHQLYLLTQNTPTFLNDSAKELKRQIKRTLVKNKFFKSAQINISFFEIEGQISYALKTSAINETAYELNREGINLEICDKVTKAISSLSSLRMGSAIYWKLMTDPKQDKLTQQILLNTQQSILETPGKNIYLVKGKTIATPSPESGAYINPAKRMIRLISEKNGYKFLDVKLLSTEDMLEANEIFLADDIQGIQWVKAFKTKRYFNKASKKFTEELNAELIQ